MTENAMKQITEAFGQRLKDSGVTRIQWIAMYYLSQNPSISQRDLSKLMNVKDSSIGRLMDRMERDSLIDRTKSKEDRRIVFVSLTEMGRDTFSNLIGFGVDFNNELIEGLTKEEVDTFNKVLSRMVENVVK